MPLYPSALAPWYEFTITPQFSTLKVGPTDGDFIQRRRRRAFPLHKIVIKYNKMTTDKEQALYEFFTARSGSWQSFTLYDWPARKWAGVYLGKGDASATVFNLRGKQTTGLKVYLNGIETTAFTKQSGTGADGQDQITFNTPPGSFVTISSEFTGIRYFPFCIFQDDLLDRTLFAHMLYRGGVTIIEVSQ